MIDKAVEICKARIPDVPKLNAIETAAATLLKNYAPPSVLEETTDQEDLNEALEEGHLWVALSDDEPIGFALVEMLDEGRPHLEEVDVMPEYGRRGIGTRLVRAVLEWTARVGYTEITLTTFRSAPWNMRFYETLGFEAVLPEVAGPELQEVLRDEEMRGLNPRDRVIMRYVNDEPDRLA